MNETEIGAQLEACHSDSFGWALNCCQGDWSEAEDILQTVYLKVMQGRAPYHGRSSFKTWLFAVIRRTAAGHRRTQWLRRALLREHAQDREPLVSLLSPQEQLGTSETWGALQTALNELPRRQGEVLHLVFYQDLAIHEAAEVMGISVGSARQHYERGKERLRRLLKPNELFYESTARRGKT